MSAWLARIVLVLAACVAGPAWAQERILAYDSTVDIHADGSLDVTERITVVAEGERIRRGIYRDFPTRYRDRHGNNVVVDFKVFDVRRDDREEPWFTENVGNGVRVNTGNDDFLPVPARYTYTLRYRTTRQLGHFASHDELYWNAIGTGWGFPIESGRVEVRLPQPVAVADMHVEGYTGAQGEKSGDFVARIPAPGIARWELTRPLQPQEGLTIVLTFPKGLIAPPTRAQNIGWFFKDNRGALVAALGLVLLLVYCVRRWRQVGRDPPAGVVFARYEPPEGHTPAGLRYMRRMRYDPRAFSADLLQLAVAGHLRIHRDDGFLKKNWWLERLSPTAATPPVDAERVLLEGLFAAGSKVQLKDSNARLLSAVRSRHERVMSRHYQPRWFNRFGGSVMIAVAIAVASIALAMMISGGAAMLAILVVAAVMVPVLVVFAVLVKAPTPEGRRLLDEIEGLRLYLGVAEREDLARLQGPGTPPLLDAARYERLLPYAVALEVEEAWTRQFTLAVGAAAAAAASSAISWYHGGGGNDLGSLVRAVGSNLSSQIASSSRPPGSSSGSGGGGSAGGGGGGGGGGGR